MNNFENSVQASHDAQLAELTVLKKERSRNVGYLKDEYGMALFGKTPEGTCPECAVRHDPEQPHNRDSLAYQYHFYDKHGRWPTWSDAMAHCPDNIKKVWTEALKERGVEI